ncbi:hypothetical protein [Luteithermobacter gelatinilyticus]|uniref:hypothetical protein n=1 Tax=Luteithermobacter gelatinilyticus TaxID=2582913 RepID=UPI00143DEC06|nr:hypothetical protein [Luteithermobacter gelatinilyticus]
MTLFHGLTFGLGLGALSATFLTPSADHVFILAATGSLLLIIEGARLMATRPRRAQQN